MKDEQLASKDVQKGGEGEDESREHVALLARDDRQGAGVGKTEGNWKGLTDYSSSPKKISPLASSAATAGQNSQTTNQSSPTKNTNTTTNGTPSWQMVCGSSSTKKPSNEGLNQILNSFDFSSEDYLDGDKTAISIAFRK